MESSGKNGNSGILVKELQKKLDWSRAAKREECPLSKI